MARVRTLYLITIAGCLGIGHPTDTKTSVQLDQRGGESVEIRSLLANNAIGVLGRPFGAVANSGDSANHQVRDPVSVENLDQASEVVRRRSGLCIRASGFRGAGYLNLCQPLHHSFPRVQAATVPQNGHIVLSGGRGVTHALDQFFR